LHAIPCVVIGSHEVAHTEPEGPLPVVVAAVTQHTFPPVQSLALVHATLTGLGHDGMSVTHVLSAGQQMRGAGQGTVVQSMRIPPELLPLVLPLELPEPLPLLLPLLPPLLVLPLLLPLPLVLPLLPPLLVLPLLLPLPLVPPLELPLPLLVPPPPVELESLHAAASETANAIAEMTCPLFMYLS
jgi:hypothetical protein